MRHLAGLAVVTVVLTACAGGHTLTDATRTTTRTPPAALWLTEKGFFARGEDGEALLHLDRADLGDRLRLGGVVARVPQVWMRAESGGAPVLWLRPERPGEEPCRVQIHVNGASLRRMGSRAALPLDGVVPPDAVDGLELYGRAAGPVPSEEGCGTLLLWSFGLRRQADDPFEGSVGGRVLAAGGGPALAGVEVRLDPVGLVVTTDARGRFDFGRLAPRRYTLEVQVTGAAPWSAELHVRSGDAVRVDVEVER